jgi:16S rRNA (adenine1518-N6/adenine1519-N6)-dimethyltransferase
MKLYSPSEAAALLKKHNFKISKNLGQNFLIDKNIIEKIVEGAGIGKDDLVIEIGPGIGALTEAAAARADKVIGIEIDRNLTPVLTEALSGYENIEIINGDILKVNIDELIKRTGKKAGEVKIIGNLPYYITTPVIMKILEDKAQAESLTVMVQREVADRIKAGPGTKKYGAITAAINYYCEVEHVIDVSREVFMPKPNVDSAVIRLRIRKTPPVDLIDEKAFFSCIKASFGQRRKTLLNSLAGFYGLDKQSVLTALTAASVAPQRRAETLSLEEFATLSNCLLGETR